MGRYKPLWVKEYFDEYGEKEWGRLVKNPVDEVKLHVHCHYLREYIKPGERVLVIGPGPGRFTQILAELGARIVAIDISVVQLELNREYSQKLGYDGAIEKWIEADMCIMPQCTDESFDSVVCYGGPISYVFERRYDAIKEINRVLKPGGLVLLSVMTLWGCVHEYLQGVLKVAPEENQRIIESGDLCPETYPESTHHCHLFRAGELREFMNDNGFEVLAMSASNCVSAVWGEKLQEYRDDPRRWSELLQMEVEACREDGCLDVGTHLIAVGKKKSF
jgi:SAM-dependent methyltransferase